MTVSVPSYTEKTWQGDGATTAFNFQTRVLEAADLKVWLIENDVPALQSLASYTLSGLGDAGGVTITFNVAPSAPKTVKARRETVSKQIAAYGDLSKVPGATTEATLDRLAMAAQDIGGMIDGLDLEAVSEAAQHAIVAAELAEYWAAQAEEIALPNGSVVFGKLATALIQTSAGGGSKTADNQLPTVKRTVDLITEERSVFATRSAFNAAIVPVSIVGAEYFDNAQRQDVFSIGTPSVVKPWHITSDAGARYWEQRFPDGKIDVKRLGAEGRLSATPADDTAALAAAFDYANRAWWTGGSGNVEARLRGSIWVPPGIYGINPATPLQMFDYMRLEGAGRGSAMFKPTTTGAGKLLDHAFIAAGPNTRCTHIEIRGIRFIGTGAQTLVDARHCGRGLIEDCEFTTQDHYDQYFNAKQLVVSGLRGVELATHDSVFLGGDVFNLRSCYFHWMDRALECGRGTNQRTPEAVSVRDCEFSDNNLPVILGGSYGGGLGYFDGNKFQRWGPAGATGTARAIDTTGRNTIIGPANYFETAGNTVAPVLFRTGSAYCQINTRQQMNYTATATVSFNPSEVVTDDGSGSIIT